MDFRLYIWPRMFRPKTERSRTPYVLEWGNDKVTLSQNEGAILSRLMHGPATCEELTDSLYGHREDGGALDPFNVVAVTVCRMRKKIRKSPLRIRKSFGKSYYLIRKLKATADKISDKIVVEGMESPVAKKGKHDGRPE